jgi:hypothetical protein
LTFRVWSVHTEGIDRTERSQPMRTIVLPGQGTPTTFDVPKDTQITVLIDGKLTAVPLRAGVTKITFLDALAVAA